jgi:CelD/BcsL family acetyltransferase involved in cellulose biosynthesis
VFKSETVLVPAAADLLVASPFALARTATPPSESGREGAGEQARRGIEPELLGRSQAANHAEAWADLARRSLDRNVFYEPDFALAAATHLRHGTRPLFLFLWDTGKARSEPGALLGLVPLMLPRGGFGPTEIFGWRNEQIPLGTPLFDSAAAPETVLAFFDWLASAAPGCAGILLPLLAEDGETAAVIRAMAARTGRVLKVFASHERAVLQPRDGVVEAADHGLQGKRRKELARLRRRLAEAAGEVRLRSAETPAELRDAVEVFMAIEASGWKGREGTAFVQDPGAATFLRSLVRSLSRNGSCRIDLLEAGGKPIAAGIVLKAGDRAWYYKTTFDEAYAAFSPGVQLTSDLTDRQRADGTMAMTDSCAIPDHPMIDAVWPQRMRVADWYVAARADARLSTTAVVVKQTAKRGVRNAARQVYRRFAKRRGKA